MAFAGLSSNTDLLGKVFLFVALSPAARANHLSKSFLTSVVQQNLRCGIFIWYWCGNFVGLMPYSTDIMRWCAVVPACFVAAFCAAGRMVVRCKARPKKSVGAAALRR